MTHMHAPLAAASSADELLQLPDVALTYATPASCASVTIAPASELHELLLPSGYHGPLRVLKSDTKRGGCQLRVELTREGSEGGVSAKVDALELATALDTNMMALGKNAYLRGVYGWKELALEKMALQVDSKRYEVVLNGSGLAKDAVASDMTVYGAKCSPQLLDDELVLRHVVPSGVDAGALKIRKSDDVAIAEGHELDCAVVLDVTAHAPLLRPGQTDDAISYLKAFDANLDETFEIGAKKRMVATVQLYGAANGTPLETELLVQGPAVPASSGNSASSYNMPSKELTFGIFAGFFGLVAMLATVVMKKKSHEKHCEERHRNASKAAQIRRVSIRMASPTAGSTHRAMDDFAHEEEEEKEYEEYGEDDGLL